MNKFSLRLLAPLALLATAGLVLADSNDTATLNQIAGYRQWTRVTKKPVEVPLPSRITLATASTFDTSSIAL
jgi:hypothetical protein